jgi:mannose-6-phosphate isomerase-like protein (cupin superfamily)
VEVIGTTERSGTTNESGQLNFPGLQVGNYRMRFSGDGVITLEREVTLLRGQVMSVDVTLNPAPKPPPPPPAPAPLPAPVVESKPVTGPTGQPQSVSVVELLEKDFVGRNPRRESLLSCSGTTRTTMLQINEPLPERMYADADVVYYVLGGEGSMRLNGKDSRIATNGFLSVPRGASHSFERRGNRPLVLLAVLGGEPCETAK